MPHKYYGKTQFDSARGDTMENPNNRIVAAGRLEDSLTLSHEVMNEPFYSGTLLVKRLSGAVDRLPVTIPGKLLAITDLNRNSLLLMSGQVRSYNKVIDGAGRLMVTLFVQSLALSPDNDTLNRVTLTGALCKPPIYRSTPFGREICDMMLAVNRAFGKSDYIPCIAWGRNAQYASRFSVGDRVRLTGRLQSREYQKLLENGEYMLRNAYEVSCFTLEAAENDSAALPVYTPPEARYAFDAGGRKHLS
jgi:primosomal replication protein N